jgi:hypothetical protein
MTTIIESLHEELLGESKEFALITKILLSELQDLKDDWHLHDEDLAHIGDQFLGHEIEQNHLDRENATKDAISCLQISSGIHYDETGAPRVDRSCYPLV